MNASLNIGHQIRLRHTIMHSYAYASECWSYVVEFFLIKQFDYNNQWTDSGGKFVFLFATKHANCYRSQIH